MLPETASSMIKKGFKGKGIVVSNPCADIECYALLSFFKTMRVLLRSGTDAERIPIGPSDNFMIVENR
jgi:hypothetical protein